MKRIAIVAISLLLFSQLILAQRTIDEIDYRRSSIYSILINNTDQGLASNVADVFIEMPLPDKYNNHDLSIKILTTAKRTPAKEKGQDFLKNNHVASHLVARWFNRNPLTGECDMSLVQQRGLYNASEFDRIMAAQSTRGNALLADAGEELLANTFVIVNDIRYIDKEKAGKIVSGIFSALGTIAGTLLGGSLGRSVQDLGDQLGDLMETLKGFKVKVNTHLYRLVWNEEVAATFYETMYTEEPNEIKRLAFENNRDLFKLEYVGSQLSSGSETSFIGVNLDTPDEMIRKACVRAIDENVANLSKNFETFKVKIRLSSVDPIQAPIGKKEEITEKSKFEVLETIIQDNRTTYRRVAIIQPLKGMIWDNRYMAEEERAVGAQLRYTTFKKISGGEILPGMLIREIK